MSVNKILDVVSYSLVSAVWLAMAIIHGNITSIFPFMDHRLLLFFLFVFGVIVIGFIMGADKLLAHMGFKGIVRGILDSFVAALIIACSTRIFFSTPGSWIMPGGRGIAGGLWSFALGLAIYFLFALLALVFLACKKKLHRYFNTSVALFVLVLLVSAQNLYFIFFLAP